MERKFDEFCSERGIGQGRDRDMARSIFKAGFDAGVDNTEEQFASELSQLERAVVALGY